MLSVSDSEICFYPCPPPPKSREVAPRGGFEKARSTLERRTSVPLALLLVGLASAYSIAGCRKVLPPRIPPRCEKGLEYRIRPSEKEPGRLIVHTLSNCSTSTTWWISRRFSTGVGHNGGDTEVLLHVRDFQGRDAVPDCLMDVFRPDAHDYAVLKPGAALEIEGRVFACTDAKLGQRYRVWAVFRDKELPPKAPPGSVHFAEELTSNEVEMQDLDYGWDQ